MGTTGSSLVLFDDDDDDDYDDDNVYNKNINKQILNEEVNTVTIKLYKKG